MTFLDRLRKPWMLWHAGWSRLILQTIKETSAWSSYTKAAQHLRPPELRQACQEIVIPELWRVLSQL